VNGSVQYRSWALRTPTGETLSAAGGICERSAPDLFLLMFPPLQLQEMKRLTNRKLQAKGRTPTTSGEILTYLGVLLLLTRFEFGERASLWSTNQEHKYIPPPAFGRQVCRRGGLMTSTAAFDTVTSLRRGLLPCRRSGTGGAS
jgi:Transposase IS4